MSLFDFKLTLDEQRLVRFLRCLPIERQASILENIAQEAVETRLPPETCENDFAALMPEPPEGGVRGDIYDGFSSDHWLFSAIQETGDGNGALLGSSYRDREYYAAMRFALIRDAERHGHYWLDTSDDVLNNILTTWRFNIVRECETQDRFGGKQADLEE